MTKDDLVSQAKRHAATLYTLRCEPVMDGVITDREREIIKLALATAYCDGMNAALSQFLDMKR